MKYRNGFVSNSSSSSFILIAKTAIPNSKNYGKTYKRGKKTYNEWEFINVKDFGEINYCRDDIMRINTIEDKIKYVMALYAKWYERDPDYFRKVLTLKNKIFQLGLSHWYHIFIPIIPLSAYWDWLGDEDKDQKIITTTYVHTECEYSGEVVKMCEDEDTSRLDSFIFNPQSFGILGGDEYEETYRLRAECIPELTYDYERIADDPDYKKGDLRYTTNDGEKVYYDHDYSWIEDCQKKVERYDKMNEEDQAAFMWDVPQSCKELEENKNENT